MLLCKFEKTFGKSETGADCHFVAGILLAERLDSTICPLVYLNLPFLAFICYGDGIPVFDGKTIEGYGWQFGVSLFVISIIITNGKYPFENAGMPLSFLELN
jgi:hypothetical protein